MNDPSELLARAREAQERLQSLQRELARRRVEGSAGGGMVRAVVSGELRVLEIQIEPQLLATGDREMLQDLSAAAVNAALTRAQQMVQEEMQKLQAGLSLPGFGGGAAPGAS